MALLDVMPERNARLNLYIARGSEDTWEQARRAAWEDRLSLSELMTRAMRLYLELRRTGDLPRPSDGENQAGFLAHPLSPTPGESPYARPYMRAHTRGKTEGDES